MYRCRMVAPTIRAAEEEGGMDGWMEGRGEERGVDDNNAAAGPGSAESGSL